MTANYKTAYDTLAVRPTASAQEIDDNFNSLVTRLKTQRGLFEPADYQRRLELINNAYAAIASPSSRGVYDEQFSAGRALGLAASAAPSVREDTASLALRAEAISLRAEAVALRADALAIHAQHDHGGRVPGAAAPAYGKLNSMAAIKRLAMVIGAAVATWMLIQVATQLFTHRAINAAVNAGNSAREKTVIQDYYQTHGVRPRSAAEAELLDAEQRKKEVESRKIERDKTKQLEDLRRFEEEGQRRADQVSRDLRYSENQAREQVRHDDEQKANRLEQKKEAAESAERARIARQEAQWRDALGR